MRNSVTFYLNGVKKEVSGKNVFLPLSSFLRYECGLTGTKVVCAEGDCGACTVMAAKWSPVSAGSTGGYQSINSCIAMTFAMDGANLVTVEGLSENHGRDMSEVQCSMVRNFGGQCGFCTPGFVMSIANMYEHKTEPSEQNAKNYLTGNLCRCTGYTPILSAALDVDIKKHVFIRDRYPQVSLDDLMHEEVLITDAGTEYFAPTSLEAACRYKGENNNVIIFSGATDLGVQLNKGHLTPRRILSLHLIPELYHASVTGRQPQRMVRVGARATLAEFQALVTGEIPSLEKFLNIFASLQIKNIGTLVGNLANASPIADMTPVLMALDAELEICGSSGKRSVKLQGFYLGYKKTDLKKDEIITAIIFNVPADNQKIENYKVSQRRDLDISTVNASFNFVVNAGKIENAKIAYGGVAATTRRLHDVEDRIIGAEISPAKIAEIKDWIVAGVTPLSDMRGTATYRSLLAGNLFEKFADEHLNL